MHSDAVMLVINNGVVYDKLTSARGPVTTYSAFLNCNRLQPSMNTAAVINTDLFPN